MQESVRRIIEAEESRMGTGCVRLTVKALHCFYVSIFDYMFVFHYYFHSTIRPIQIFIYVYMYFHRSV